MVLFAITRSPCASDLHWRGNFRQNIRGVIRWRAGNPKICHEKPLTMPDEPQPRSITRADLVTTEGFGLEDDGRMKTVFPTLEAAQKRARDIKAEFPMLQVKVYDAAEKKLLELSPTE